MMALASRPTSLPEATAALSMSPVESWTSPYLAAMPLAWVPLPAPGGPSRIRFMSASSPPCSLAFLMRPSYWWARRWLCICATVSMVTDTAISSEVPPK